MRYNTFLAILGAVYVLGLAGCGQQAPPPAAGDDPARDSVMAHGGGGSTPRRNNGSSAALVHSPGGKRPAGCIHEMPSGSRLMRDGLTVMKPDGSKEKVSACSTKVPAPKFDKMTAGSQSSATEATELPLNGHEFPMEGYQKSVSGFTYLNGTWTVPSPPPVAEGQTLYIWNGLEPSDYSCVIQPVLGWGRGANGAGVDAWSIASWICCGNSTGCHHSAPVLVNPGDSITGNLTLKNSTWTITTTDNTLGKTTVLNVSASAAGGAQTLSGFFLETYSAPNCAGYPATSPITYSHSTEQDVAQSASADSVFIAQTNVQDGCGELATAGRGEVSFYISNSASSCDQFCASSVPIYLYENPGVGYVYVNRSAADVPPIPGYQVYNVDANGNTSQVQVGQEILPAFYAPTDPKYLCGNRSVVSNYTDGKSNLTCLGSQPTCGSFRSTGPEFILDNVKDPGTVPLFRLYTVVNGYTLVYLTTVQSAAQNLLARGFFSDQKLPNGTVGPIGYVCPVLPADTPIPLPVNPEATPTPTPTPVPPPPPPPPPQPQWRGNYDIWGIILKAAVPAGWDPYQHCIAMMENYGGAAAGVSEEPGPGPNGAFVGQYWPWWAQSCHAAFGPTGQCLCGQGSSSVYSVAYSDCSGTPWAPGPEGSQVMSQFSSVYACCLVNYECVY